MRACRLVPILLAAALVGPGTAHALPPCSSSVGVSGTASQQLGEFTTHGFGGGTIGALQLPYIAGVTPPTTTVPLEGDAVGFLVNLDFDGVLGGGTTSLRPLAGIGGPTVTVSGAQIFTAMLFTGHYKAEPRNYKCQSVVTPNLIWDISYFEITLAGLLTPTGAGSPLAGWGQGFQVGAGPGDNTPL
jgi:hypothetical protein